MSNNETSAQSLKLNVATYPLDSSLAKNQAIAIVTIISEKVSEAKMKLLSVISHSITVVSP